MYGAAEALLEKVGGTGQGTVTRVQDRYLGLAMEAMGEPAFRKALAAGRALSLKHALDAAFHRRS